MEGSSLGLLRNERKPIFVNKKEISLPTDFQIKRKDLPALHISKVNRESSVHRKVPLDCISVKLFDKKGKLKGEGIFIGLFTSVTYNRSLSSIPYLRRKAEKVLQRSGFKPGTHDYRSLRHILEKYPRDEFFQIKINKLTSFCEKIMKLHERRQVALFVREDLFSRYVSCLVYVPRDRFETALRLKFKTILENAFNGEAISYHLSIDDSPLARVMYTINIDPFKAVKFDQDKLEKQLQDVAHSWPQKLFDAALSKTGDDARAFYIRESFGNSFSRKVAQKETEKKVVNLNSSKLDDVAKKQFIKGAKAAYEMIITSFAKGDKNALKPLLNKEIYQNFSHEIDRRKKENLKSELTFVGVKSAEIKNFEKKDNIYIFTVNFVSEIITYRKDKNNKVIEGNPDIIKTVNDVWKFSKNMWSSNPNWYLVETQV